MAYYLSNLHIAKRITNTKCFKKTVKFSITSGHAFPRRKAVQEPRWVLQRLGTSARCGWRLRRRQAGSLPGRLGGRSGLGESPSQRGRRGQRRGGDHLQLTRGADGGISLRVAEAIWGGGAGRSGRQADWRRLTCGLVGHGSRWAVRAFRRDRSQLLCCRETTKKEHKMVGVCNISKIKGI